MSKEDHKSFIQNHLETVNALKSMLVNNCVKSDNADNIVYMDQSFSDEGVTTSYFVGDEEIPRCKIVASDTGLYFYEKKNKDSN